MAEGYQLTKSTRRFKPGRCPTCAVEDCNIKTCVLSPYCTKHTKEKYGVMLKKVDLPNRAKRTTGLFYMWEKVLPANSPITLPYSGKLYAKSARRKKGVQQDPEITKMARRIKYVAYDFKTKKAMTSTDVRNYPGRFIRVAQNNERPNVTLDTSKGFHDDDYYPSIIQGERYRLRALIDIKPRTELLMQPFTRAQFIATGNPIKKQPKKKSATVNGVRKKNLLEARKIKKPAPAKRLSQRKKTKTKKVSPTTAKKTTAKKTMAKKTTAKKTTASILRAANQAKKTTASILRAASSSSSAMLPNKKRLANPLKKALKSKARQRQRQKFLKDRRKKAMAASNKKKLTK